MTEGARLKLECNILRKMKPTVFVANGPVISRRVNGGFMPYKLEPGTYVGGAERSPPEA